MKINPIKSVENNYSKPTNFKQKGLVRNVNKQIKNVFMPTVFALAIFSPSTISAQKVIAKPENM